MAGGDRMKTADIQQVMFRLITETGKTNVIELTPGQIISVLLKEVLGNMAVLAYQGKDILARLDVEVPAGERLKCLVEGEKNGQIVLRVISGNREEISAQALKNILKSLGLADDKSNLRLVTEMVKQEMPLAPDAARMLSAFVRTLNLSENEIWIPVFMYNKGIALTREMYQAVRELFSDMKYLQTELNKLIGEVQNLASTAKPGSQPAVLAADINQVLKGLYLNDTDGPEVIASKLAAVLQQLYLFQPETTRDGTGLQSAADQVRAFMAGTIPAAGQAGSSPNAAVPVQSETVQQPAAGQASGQPSPAQIITRLADLAERTTLSIDKEARNQMLIRVRALLDGSNNEETAMPDLLPMLKKLAAVLTEKGGQEYSALVQLARNMAGKLELIRGFNSMPEAGREGMVIVYSSVRYDNREEPLRMVITYRHGGKNKKRDFSNCKVEIKLNTPFLGLVRCEVHINHRNLALQFTAGSEQAGRIIDSARDILFERLREMRYSVKISSCKVESGEEAVYLPGHTHDIPGLYKINLRV